MKTTANKKELNVSNEILELNETFNDNNITIINLKKENKNILKSVFDIYMKEIKELKNNDEYVNYSKKSLALIISVRLENKLNTKFTQVIKSIFIYINSNSTLNFNDISITKFIDGMKLINSDKNSITKFKSNEDLLKALKDSEKQKLKEKLAKFSKQA